MSIDSKISFALSPWQMFLHADWIVQSVMVLLVIASIATWTILIAKMMELFKIQKYFSNAYKLLGTTKSLSNIKSLDHFLKNGMVQELINEVNVELAQSKEITDKVSIKQRIESRLQSTEIVYLRHLKIGISVLATIGAVGPFIGLFGTVWGIMNSFIGIAQSNTTNLAVVAPGIAEALLATALGLAAAIPAVIIYNILTRKLNAIADDLSNVSASIQQIVSRDLDYKEMSKYGNK